MSGDNQQEEFDLIGNILSEDGYSEDYSPEYKHQEPNNFTSIISTKTNSTPVNNLKNELKTNKMAETPVHELQNEPHSIGFPNHQDYQHSHYSPEVQKFNSNYYMQPYAMNRGHYPMSNHEFSPQLVNMNGMTFYLKQFLSL